MWFSDGFEWASDLLAQLNLTYFCGRSGIGPDRQPVALVHCHLCMHSQVESGIEILDAKYQHTQNIAKLKADRPHPRDYSTHRQTPWTDNDSSLPFAALGKTVQPWERWRTDGRTDGRTDSIKYIISLASRSIIKSWWTASGRLSAYAHWLQAHGRTPWTANDTTNRRAHANKWTNRRTDATKCIISLLC